MTDPAKQSESQAGESHVVRSPTGESQVGRSQAGESQPSRGEPRSQVPWRALTFAVVAVVVGLGAGFLMLRLADGGEVDVRLGDSEFSAGSAESRGNDIAQPSS